MAGVNKIPNRIKGNSKPGGLDRVDIAEEKVANGLNDVVGVTNGVASAVGAGSMFALPVAGALTGATHWTADKIGATTVANYAGNAKTAITGFNEKTLGAAFKNNKFAMAVGNASSSLAAKSSGLLSTVGLKSAAGLVADVPKALAEKPVTAGLMEGAFIATSGLQMASGALGFSKSLFALKQMAFDLTGKKFSTMEVLFKNDVPEVLKNERGQILKSLAVEEGGGALSMGVAIKSAARVVSGWVWPVVMGVTIGASMMVGEGMLPTYDQASKAFNAGKPIPPEMYAKIIGVSKELTNHSGEQGAFAQAIATQYAGENANPADVIREMESGALKKRIEKIIAENEAKAPAKTEEKSVEEQPKISHVAALEQPREKKPLAHLTNKEREIVGDKTREIVNAALANNQTAGQAM
jgi:hypothetical protein